MDNLEYGECRCCGAERSDSEAGYAYCAACVYYGCEEGRPRCAVPLPAVCQECGATAAGYGGLCAACYALEVAD